MIDLQRLWRSLEADCICRTTSCCEECEERLGLRLEEGGCPSEDYNIKEAAAKILADYIITLSLEHKSTQVSEEEFLSILTTE